MRKPTGSPAGLRMDQITASLAGVRIIEEVTVAVGHGEFVGVMGTNGSGKSTLLRTVFRSVRPAAGTVRIDDADLWRIPVRTAAALRAIVTQMQDAADDLTVAETVMTGALAAKPPLRRAAADDHRRVGAALHRVGMADAAQRLIGTLSGGERQRVLIARAIAQDAPFVVLDEPTNHLDVGAALDVLSLVSGLGVGVLAALHDLDQAAAHCDRVVILADGRVVASGPPSRVLTPELIGDVFGVRAIVDTNPLSGRPRVTVAARPAGRVREASSGADGHHPSSGPPSRVVLPPR